MSVPGQAGPAYGTKLCKPDCHRPSGLPYLPPIDGYELYMKKEASTKWTRRRRRPRTTTTTTEEQNKAKPASKIVRCSPMEIAKAGLLYVANSGGTYKR